ncbi:MAG: hypothetical protein ACKO3R_01725 [bacterium]
MEFQQLRQIGIEIPNPKLADTCQKMAIDLLRTIEKKNSLGDNPFNKIVTLPTHNHPILQLILSHPQANKNEKPLMQANLAELSNALHSLYPTFNKAFRAIKDSPLFSKEIKDKLPVKTTTDSSGFWYVFVHQYQAMEGGLSPETVQAMINRTMINLAKGNRQEGAR